MKICHNCGASANDDASFCTACGASFLSQGTPANEPPARNSSFDPAYNPTANNQYQAYAAPPPFSADPIDHTKDFTPEDISENKVFAVCVYLFDYIGIIVGLLAANSSPFVRFHVRQALKITVLSTAAIILGLILVWTVLAPIAAGVFCSILFVVKIIGFVHAWKGQAKELPVIRDFLK